MVMKFFKLIPGGMVILPLLIGAIINTLFPDLFTTLGGMSMNLFKTGTLALAALILFSTGTGIKLKAIPEILKRFGLLAIAKLIFTFGLGFAFLKVFGLDGIAGISAVAFIAVVCACNPGVYAGLVADYGEPEDMGNFAIINLITMPAIPIFIISAGSGGGFNPMDVVTVLVPLILGIILGNIDPVYSKIHEACMPVALPFLGFCFGSSVNIGTAISAGIPGIVLGVIMLVLSVIWLTFVDHFIGRRPGYAGCAMSCPSGIAIAVPAMLPEAFAAYVPTAVAEIALALLICAIFLPFVTKGVVKLWGTADDYNKKHGLKQYAEQPAEEAPAEA